MAIKSITPHLVIKGAADAIEYYKKAFGAVEQARMPGPDGVRLMHAQITIGGSTVMLADEFPEMGSGSNQSPATLGGTTVVQHLLVDNCDEVFNQAVAAGATVIMPPMDMFWGDRYAQIVDPFGHRWSISHPNETLTFDEMKERGEAAFKSPECAE